ncbi:MAG: 4Fe-4S binding protein, partial [Promethearchaeota archaeon]
PRPDLCTECSACSRNCPVEAIFLKEVKGCGCLWNVKARLKSKSDGNGDCGDNCCG